jgi:hypothetical protein
MKGLKAIVALAAAAALLTGAAPASAGAAAYKHYVGCGSLKTPRALRNAKPAHVCGQHAKKVAFFMSTKADVYYTVCVRFPGGRSICAHQQPPPNPKTGEQKPARQGRLYVNTITSTIPGRHRVTWFVKGKRVGSFVFRVKG